MPWPAQYLNMEVDLLDPEADEVLLGLLSRDNEPVPKHEPYRQADRELKLRVAQQAAWARHHKERARRREEQDRDNRQRQIWAEEERLAIQRATRRYDRALRRLRNPGVLVETQRLVNRDGWPEYWISDRL